MTNYFSRRAVLLSLAGLGGVAALMRRDGLAVIRSQPSEVSLPGELNYAKQRADLCGAGNAVGVGLRGEYFSAPDLGGSALLTRVDRTVDFDASFELPPEHAAHVRSIRWTGWIKPPVAGKFRFHVDAPGMRVKVTHQWVAGEGAPPDAAVAMALGRFYPITVEISAIDASFQGRWRLEWTAPHGLRFLIPTALLFGPTAS